MAVFFHVQGKIPAIDIMVMAFIAAADEERVERCGRGLVEADKKHFRVGVSHNDTRCIIKGEIAMQDQSRSEIVEQLFRDLPQVHTELGNPEGGVWRTDRPCYEFIASHCGPRSRTLETGLGLSTLLFVLLGTEHTCVAPWTSEIEGLFSHCRERGIATDRLTLNQGFSDEVLPTLQPSELDLFFIDGGHGFPTPMLDWYYGAGRLRRGGMLVIDDIHLPAVQMLLDFLDADPRWQCVDKTRKWAAYERLGEGTLREEHSRQQFLKRREHAGRASD
nr:class I SAM-dependent methyltransferase [Thiocapsa sp. KS1]